MRGYRREHGKTAATIRADGWLRTGDIATIDDDGYVRIVDRKKEIIINATGKNMSPLHGLADDSVSAVAANPGARAAIDGS
jgi:long-subunit acyl-CoA synthetase (AMP-forming)